MNLKIKMKMKTDKYFAPFIKKSFILRKAAVNNLVSRAYKYSKSIQPITKKFWDIVRYLKRKNHIDFEKKNPQKNFGKFHNNWFQECNLKNIQEILMIL